MRDLVADCIELLATRGAHPIHRTRTRITTTYQTTPLTIELVPGGEPTHHQITDLSQAAKHGRTVAIITSRHDLLTMLNRIDTTSTRRQAA